MVYNQPHPELDAVFSALSDATRRAIVERLAEGEARVSELAEPHAMTIQMVSKHIRKLEQAGIVSRRRQGREVFCSLVTQPMQGAVTWIEEQRRFWEVRLDRLGRLVESESSIPPSDQNDT